MSDLLVVGPLDVAYGDFQVLWQAELRVAAGEIVAVLGPNGAGKSTLMNTIAGLITPRAGHIAFLDKRIDGLTAHRTVGEGIAHVLVTHDDALTMLRPPSCLITTRPSTQSSPAPEFRWTPHWGA